MKIAILSSEYPPKWGGVGIVAFFLSNHLAADGHEVHIITRKQPGKIPPQPKNVKVSHVSWLKLPMVYITSFTKHAIKKLNSLGVEFDIIHVLTPTTLLKRYHYKSISTPIVSTLCGTWRNERQGMRLSEIALSLTGLNELGVLYISPFYDRLEHLAMKHSNAVVVISELEMKLHKKFGKRNLSSRELTIPCGVETRLYSPEVSSGERKNFKKWLEVDNDERILLFVGRFVMRKGIIKLINVFSEVCKTEKNVTLLLVGDGPLKKKVEKMINELGIQDKVIILKDLSFDELKKCYSNADIFTFFPTYEGQGLVIIEAMASGTPCVATAEGGIPEMVTHGKSGYVVQQHEFDKMVRYIKKLLTDDKLLKNFGTSARRATEEAWDWELVTKKYEKLYLEIINAPKHSSLRPKK